MMLLVQGKLNLVRAPTSTAFILFLAPQNLVIEERMGILFAIRSALPFGLVLRRCLASNNVTMMALLRPTRHLEEDRRAGSN